MPQPSLQSMTLREKLSAGHQAVRELVEHLDRGFLPRVRELAEMVAPHVSSGSQRSGTSGVFSPAASGVHSADASGVYRLRKDSPPGDHTVRNQVAQVLSHELFTDELYDKFDQILCTVEEDVDRVLASSR